MLQIHILHVHYQLAQNMPGKKWHGGYVIEY